MAESQSQDENAREAIKSTDGIEKGREGILFILDATPDMHETRPNNEPSYFSQCLGTYKAILSAKLSWNRRDWMGLILFGTNKWDQDPERKHILTLVKFQEVSIDMMHQSIEMVKKLESSYYKGLASESDYPLHDVLWDANRCFDNVKVSMKRRQVVLLTCRDNPCSDDAAEQNRIRLRAKTFSDINVHLRIVGLGDSWNHEIFYKDIEMLANNMNIEDVKRIHLADLEKQVRFTAKPKSHIKWNIGKEVELPIILTSFSSTTTVIKKTLMNRKTNEILRQSKHWKKPGETEDCDNDESQEVKYDVPDATSKGTTHGGKLITFNGYELKEIRRPRPDSIKLIGFKKICYNLMYHISPVNFLAIDPSALKEEIELFGALLKKCDEKNVMAVCTMNYRSAPYIVNIIPNRKLDGFYIYQIPYKQQVNNLRPYTAPYVYGGDDATAVPTDEKGIKLWQNLVQKLRTVANAESFRNPSLYTQLAYIQTLALDSSARPTPKDDTLPDVPFIDSQLRDSMHEFANISTSQPLISTSQIKRSNTANENETVGHKMSKIDEENIRISASKGDLAQHRTRELRTFARNIGLKSTGLKSQLIEVIMEHFENQKRYKPLV